MTLWRADHGAEEVLFTGVCRLFWTTAESTLQIHTGHFSDSCWTKSKKKQKTKKNSFNVFLLEAWWKIFFFYNTLFTWNMHLCKLALIEFIHFDIGICSVYIPKNVNSFSPKSNDFFLLISKTRLLNGSCHVGSLIIYFYWVSKLNKCRCKATKQTWQARSCGPIREDIVIII